MFARRRRISANVNEEETPESDSTIVPRRPQHFGEDRRNRGILALINYYIVFDTHQRGYTMVQRWCFQSIRQLPRGAAARHPGRFKDSFSSLSSIVNNSFLAPFFKTQKRGVYFRRWWKSLSHDRLVSQENRSNRQGSRNHGE